MWRSFGKLTATAFIYMTDKERICYIEVVFFLIFLLFWQVSTPIHENLHKKS